MSIDDRLRSGLAGNAAEVTSSLEADLDQVRARHRRRSRIRTAAVAAAVAAVIVPGTALTASLVGDRDGRDPGPAGTTDVDVVGSYRVTVSAPGSGYGGTWGVTLDGDGTAVLDPPQGYPGNDADGTYSVDGDELTSNLLLGFPGCQRTEPFVGQYRVRETATGLSFTPVVADTCPARAALFAETWEVQP